MDSETRMRYVLFAIFLGVVIGCAPVSTRPDGRAETEGGPYLGEPGANMSHNDVPDRAGEAQRLDLTWSQVGADGIVADVAGVVSLISARGGAVVAQAPVVLDLTDGKYLSVKVASLNDDLHSVHLELSVGDASFTRTFTSASFDAAIDRATGGGLINHAGEPQRLAFGAIHFDASAGAPALAELADIKAMRVVVTPDADAVAEVAIAEVTSHESHPDLHAAAILVFDDTRYPETYHVAFPLLRSHGVRGTIAVEAQQVRAGGVTLEQLREMYAAGWDMLPHGLWGDSLLQYDVEGKRKQMQDSFDFLVTNGFTRSNRHFVLPGGEHDADVWRLAGELGFRTLRIADKQRFETLDPLPELTLVRAVHASYGQNMDLHLGLIDRLADRGGLGVWEFHRILDTGQSSSSSLDYTRENLDLLLTHLAAKGIPVVTPEEVWGN